MQHIFNYILTDGCCCGVVDSFFVLFKCQRCNWSKAKMRLTLGTLVENIDNKFLYIGIKNGTFFVVIMGSTCRVP